MARRKPISTKSPDAPPSTGTLQLQAPDTPKYGPKELSITDLTTSNGDLLRQMFAQGINSVRAFFSARRTCLKRDGDLVDLGPDFLKRISGLDLLLNLCTRGRKHREPEEGRTGITWEDLQALWKESEAAENDSRKGKPNGDSQQKKTDASVAPGAAVPQVETAPEIGPPANSHNNSIRICDLTDRHGEEIEHLFRIGLESLREVFSARKTRLNRDGDVVDLGPDYDVHLAAMNLFQNLSIRGRKLLPPPKYVDKPWTLEEFYKWYAENKANPDPETLKRKREAEEEQRRQAAFIGITIGRR